MKELTMRAAILASSIVLAFAPACLAMPLATLSAPSKVVQVHGCHHYYAHDLSGWHRHDKECRTLRGAAGRKGRNPAKG
jgi:hypothetical protein